MTLICVSKSHAKTLAGALNDVMSDGYNFTVPNRNPLIYSPKFPKGTPNIQISYKTLPPLSHQLLWKVYSLYAKKFKTNFYYDSEKIKKKDYSFGEMTIVPDTKLLRWAFKKDIALYNKYLQKFEEMINNLKVRNKK